MPVSQNPAMNDTSVFSTVDLSSLTSFTVGEMPVTSLAGFERYAPHRVIIASLRRQCAESFVLWAC
jgi:hypothetical protein